MRKTNPDNMTRKFSEKLVLLFILYGYQAFAYKNIPDEDYNLMPEVFHLDNFDRCLEVPDTLYCSINYTVQALDELNPSKVWKVIERTKRIGKYYRHDWLRYRICVPLACPNVSRIHYKTANGSENLAEELTKCMDLKFVDQGLKGDVHIEYCESNGNPYPIQTYDILVGLGILTILGLVIFGTAYEGLARLKSEKEYEEKVNKRTFGKIIACFSVIKNFERLKKQNTDPDTVDLKSIQGIRVLNMACVIMSHSILVAILTGVINPKFVELTTDSVFNMLIVNGWFIVQTFFAISGFLLSYHFLLIVETRKNVKWSYILLAFINRYIRLTPALLLMVAFNGTWLAHMGRGPGWGHIIGDEYKFCRQNGWINLLYLNNYFRKEEQCMEQTWYIAADTQMFAIFLFVVVLIWKYQNHTKKILIACGLFCTFLPVIVHYALDIEILFRFYPEAMYKIFLTVPSFHIVHTSIHANIGGYATGVIGGYIFYKHRGRNIFKNKPIFVLLWWITVFAIPLGIIFSAYFLYKDDFHTPRIVAALYSGITRPLFASAIVILMIGACFKQGWFGRYFLEWQPFQYLGRLTYCVYLVHTDVVRIRGSAERTLHFMSEYTLLTEVISDVTVSYLFGFLLCMVAEMPMSGLQKLMIPTMEEKRLKLLSDKSLRRVTNVVANNNVIQSKV